MNIDELKEKKEKKLVLDIRGIDEDTKARLRGAIRALRKDRNNMKVEIIDEQGLKPCGAIFINQDTVKQFEEILGNGRVKI